MSFDIVEVVVGPQIVAQIVSDSNAVSEVVVSPIGAVEIVSAGPQGPIGNPGLGAVFRALSFTGVAGGQTLTLANPVGGLSELVVNGLVENNANFSIAGVTLTIPPGLVWNGAACTFRYSNV